MEKELLEETLKHLSQAIDMLEMMSISSHDEMIGPLEILKRDLESLYFKINNQLYPS